MAKRYNHAFDIAFEVISEHPTGKDVTPEMFRAAILKRVADLDAADEWKDVMITLPFDSYEMEAGSAPDGK